jgi:hypothetical protein
MCLLPALAAGVKPKTAALGMLSPAAAVVSAMSNKKNRKADPAQTTSTPGVIGPSPSYGG